jgi:uncharacterized protein
VRLIPRDERFFDLFAEMAGMLTQSAAQLQQLFADPSRLDEHVTTIKNLEHQADRLTAEANRKVDTTFVTPLDREDIHTLVNRLDNVVDLIDGCARRAQIYRITEARDPAIRMCAVLGEACGQIREAVASMKKPQMVYEHGVRIKRLEEQGDAIYHDTLGQLFAGTPDPLTVMKWKDLYDCLETAIDECHYVSMALESISLKNS